MGTSQHRQQKTGVVTSAGMNKTIVVAVENTFLHTTYKRVVRRTKKFKAHDERQECGPGDIVRIVETRPLSKTKRWRLAEVIKRAK
ncbi:MAG: 30S ribosomal protein S17 [Candidatus Abyssobacteria bacterium SURF_17]|jgi:small subunit ribosomal protein S17|uniref:Small ribosomal subunit protein uS17 n=1 Tax=Candidatus Abyssobacteria bacterium SURF_17 TaxID=2093361 RepID=A0A419EVN8_9BACT|nr:MAG: 30S ribosomal protein S17 [Candidatus Abyssubacteria bacterium SURF_17]